MKKEIAPHIPDQKAGADEASLARALRDRDRRIVKSDERIADVDLSRFGNLERLVLNDRSTAEEADKGVAGAMRDETHGGGQHEDVFLTELALPESHQAPSPLPHIDGTLHAPTIFFEDRYFRVQESGAIRGEGVSFGGQEAIQQFTYTDGATLLRNLSVYRPAGTMAHEALKLIELPALDDVKNAPTASRQDEPAPAPLRDTRAPDVPVVDPVGRDGVLNAQASAAGVAVSGSAEPNSTVTVRWGGTELRAQVGEAGDWTVVFAAGSVPDDGRAPIVVHAVDAAGNVSPAATQNVEVDRTPPAAPAIAAVGRNDVVNARQRDAGVTVGGQAEAGALVEVGWGRVRRTVTADATGRWSVVFDSGEVPADGASALSARATDQHGNVGASASRTVTVDTRPPAAPAIEAVGGDDVVNLAEAKAGVAVSGSAEAGTVVTVGWGSATHTAVADASGRWSVLFGRAEIPVDGGSVVTAKAEDRAGNASDAAVHAVKADTVAPLIPTLDAVGKNDVVNAAGGSAGVVLHGHAEAGARIEVSWGGAVRTAVASPSGEWSAAFGQLELPPDGRSTVSVSALDAAGNRSESVERSVIVDVTPPQAPVIGAIGGDNVVNGAEARGGVVIGGTAEAGATVTVTVGAAMLQAVAGADGHWRVRAAVSELGGDGMYIVTATATDRAGNASEYAVQAVTLSTHAQAPTIATVAGDDFVNAAEAANGVAVSGFAEAGSRVDVSWGSASRTVVADVHGSWSVMFGADALPGNGRSSIQAVATDPAGNVSELALRNVEIGTTAAPLSVDPVSGDNIVSASERAAGVDVSGTATPGALVSVLWGGRQKSVDVDAQGHWVVHFDASELPPPGTSAVSASAVDAHGNWSGTAKVDVLVNANQGLMLAAGQDTGVVGDNLTNRPQPIVQVSVADAQAGEVLTVTCGGVAVGAVTLGSADIAAGWVQLQLSDLSQQGGDGVKHLAAQLQSGSNAPVHVGTLDITLDTAAPAAPQLALSALSDTGADHTDRITSDATPTLQVQLGAGSELGDRVDVLLDGAVVATHAVTAADLAQGYALVTTGNLGADGPKSLSAVVTDSAGNVSLPSADLDIQLQHVGAGAPALSLTSGAATDPVTGLPLTRDATPDLRLDLAATSAQAGDVVTLQCDGTDVVSVTLSQSDIDNGYLTVSLPPLAVDGRHVLTAYTQDHAGNVSAPSAPLDIVLDTTPPAAPTVVLASDSGPGTSDRYTNDARLDLPAPEAGAHYEYSSDGTHWNQSYAPVEGANTVYVSQVDAAGNRGAASNRLDFVLDTQAPANVALTPQTVQSTSAPPVLSGTVDNPTGELLTVKVVINNLTYETTTTDGSWSVDLAQKDANGQDPSFAWQSYQAVVTVADQANPAVSITVANAVTFEKPGAPQASVGIAGMDHDSNGADWITNDGVAGRTVSGTYTGTLGADETIKVYDGTTWYDATTVDTVSHTWTYVDGGAHTVSWTIKAAAYNRSTDVYADEGRQAQQAVTYDVDGPAVPTVALASDSGPGTSDRYTNDARLDLPAPEAGGHYEYSSDGTHWDQSYAPVEGANTVYVSQVDAAGNRGAASNRLDFVLDTQAPANVALTPQTVQSTSAPPVLGGTVDNPTGELLTVTVDINGLRYVTTTTNGSWSVDLAQKDANGHDPSFAYQSYQAVVTVADQANPAVSVTVANAVTFDPPPPPQASVVIAGMDHDSNGADWITNDGVAGRTVSGTYTGTLGADETIKVYDGTTWYDATTVDTVSHTWTYVDGGAHTVSWTIKAAAYNRSTDVYADEGRQAQQAVTYDVDGPAVPTVALASDSGPSTSDRYTNDARLDLPAPEAGGHYEYSSDGTHWDQSYAPVEGANTVYVSQVDAAGNRGAASNRLDFVLDTQAPANVALTPQTVQSTSAPPVLGGTVDNPTGELLTVTVVINNLTYVTTTTDGSWSVDLAQKDANGQDPSFAWQSYQAVVTVADQANPAVSITVANAVTFEKPGAPQASVGIAGMDHDSNGADWITNDGAAGRTVSGTYTGTLGADETIKVYDGTTWYDATTVDTVAHTWTYVDGGAHTVSWTIKAAAYNRSTDVYASEVRQAQQAVTYDVDGPAAPTVALASDSGPGTSDRYTNDARLDLPAPEAGGHYEYSSDGTHWNQGYAPVEGANTVYVSQVDAAGNRGAASNRLDFVLDTQAPANVALTPQTVQSTSAPPVLGGTVDNPTGELLTVTVDINGLRYVTTTTNGSWSVDLAQKDANGQDPSFAYQSYQAVVTVADQANPAVSVTVANAVTFDPPPPPQASVVIAGMDHDSNGADWITNDGVAGRTVSGTYTGTLGADETIKVYDGTTWYDATTVDTVSHTWTYVDGGAHTVSWTIKAAAYNRSTDVYADEVRQAQQAVTYDVDGPAVPTVALASDSGPSTSDRYTNDARLDLPAPEAGGHYEYSSDGTHWSQSYAPVEGANTVYVSQVDAAGNRSAASNRLDFVLDTQAPANVALTPQTVQSTSAPPVLGGTVDNPTGELLTVTVVINNLTYVTTTTDGSWSVDLAQKDANGQDPSFAYQSYQAVVTVADQANPAVSVTVANAVTFDPPPPPQASVVIAGMDHDSNGADWITNDGAAGRTVSGTYTGTLGADETIKVYDGTAWHDATTVDTVSHTWTYVDGGAHTVSWTIKAAAYNRSTDVYASEVRQAQQAVTYDVDGPAAPTVALASDSGPSTSDRYTNDARLDLPAPEAGGHYEYSSDGTHWNQSYAPVEGANTVYVSQVDAAGNRGAASNRLDFVLDTQAPANVALTPQTVQSTSAPPVLGGTVDNPTGELLTVTVVINNLTYVTTTTDGSWSVDLAQKDANGHDPSFAYQSYQAVVTVADQANPAVSVTVANAVTFDPPPPPQAIVVIAGMDHDSNGADWITNDGAAGRTVSGTYTGTLGADETIKVYDGTTWYDATTVDTVAHTWTYVDGGAHTASWTIKAAAYNRSTDVYADEGRQAQQAVTYDVDGPAVPTVALASDSGPGTSDRYTNDARLDLPAPEAGGHYEYSSDGTHWNQGYAPVEGANTVYVSQVDAAGNRSAASNRLDFVLDTQAPANVALTPQTVQSTSAPPVLSGTVDNPTGELLTVKVVINNLTYETTTTDGSWSVDLAQKDANGQDPSFAWQSYQAVVTVADQANPAVSITVANAVTFEKPGAPQASVGIAGMDHDSNGADWITNDGAAGRTVSGTYTGTLGADETIKVYDGTTWYDATTVDTVAHTWTYVDGGAHTASWTIKAAAYNRSTDVYADEGRQAQQAVTYDVDGPAVPTVALASDSGPGTSDRYTNDARLDLPAPEAGGHYEYSSDGTHWNQGYAPVEGANTVYVSQVDAAGNRSAASNRLDFVLDTQAPANVALTPQTVQSTSAPPVLSGTVDNPTGELLTVTVVINNLTYVTTTTDGSWSVDLAQKDANGQDPSFAWQSYQAVVTVADQANPAVSITVANAVTFEKPGAPQAIVVIAGMDHDSNGADWITNDGAAGRTVSGTYSGTLGADETIKVYDGTTWYDATTVDTVAHTWTYVDGGAHTVSWTIKAAAYNRSTDVYADEGRQAQQAVTYDVDGPAAPTVALASDSGPGTSDRYTNDARLDLPAPEAGGHYEYSSDGTHWSQSYAPVEGANTVYVSQVDAAGNRSAASNRLDFVLDTQAPANVALTPQTVQSTSAPPVLGGTVDNPTGELLTVTVDINGLRYVTTTTNGSWSVDLAQKDANGHDPSFAYQSYQAVVTVADQANPAVSVTVANAVTFDPPPPPQASVVIAGMDHDSNGADWITNDGVAGRTVSGTYTGTLGADETIKVYDGTTWHDATTVDTVSHTWTYVDGGAHTVSWTIKAAAYNRSTDVYASEVRQAQQAVTYDVDGPAAPTVALASDSGPSTSDRYTNDARLDLPAPEAGGHYEYSSDGTHWDQSYAPVEGANTVYVSQVDAAGNRGAASNRLDFVLDTQAPANVALTPQTVQSTSAPPVLGGTVDNPTGELLTVTVDINGLRYVTTTTNGSWSVDLAQKDANGHDPSFAYQSYQAVVTVADQANPAVSVTVANAVTFDPPPPPQASVVIAGMDHDSNGADWITNDGAAGRTVSGTYTGTLGADETIKVYDGTTWYDATTVDTVAHTWTYVDGGAHTASWTIKAAAYNRSTDVYADEGRQAQQAVTYDVDGPAVPTVALASDSGPSTSDRYTNDARLDLPAPEAGGHYEYSSDGTHWDQSYAPVEGANTVYVSQVDAAGNRGAASNRLDFVLDTQAPANVALTPQTVQSTSAPPVLGGTVDNPTGELLTVTVDINGLRYVTTTTNGSWSVDLAQKDANGHDPSFAYQSYQAVVTVADQANPAVSVTVANAVTFDPPPPPQASVVIAGMDHDSNGADWITNDGVAGRTVSGTYTGTLGADETIKVYDGTTWHDATTVDTVSHTWTYVDGGAHTVSWTIKAAAYNRSTDVYADEGRQAQQAVTYDVDGPAVPTVALASDSGPSTSDRYTNDARLDLPAPEAGGHYEYSSDGTHWDQSYAPVEGANTVYVSQVDAAGNRGAASNRLDFVLDTQAPANVALTPQTVQSTSAPPVLGGTVDNPTGELLTVTVDINGLRYVTTTTNGSWSVDLAQKDANGHDPSFAYQSYQAVVTVADQANPAVSVTVANAVTFDPPPPPQASVVIAGMDHDSNGADWITNDGAAGRTVSGTYTGTLGGDETIKVYDGTVWHDAATVDTVSHTWTYVDGGAHTVSWTIKAAAYNRSTDVYADEGRQAQQAVTYDVSAPAAPSVSLVADTANSAVSGSSTDCITRNGELQWSGTLENGGVVEYSTDNVHWTAWSAGFTPATGVNIVYVHQKDVAGNYSPSSSLTYSYLPALSQSVTTSITSVATHGGATIGGGGWSTDAAPIINVSLDRLLNWPNREYVVVYEGTTLLGSWSGGNLTASIQSTVQLSEGAHTLTAYVVDGAGNAEIATAQYAIKVDTQVAQASLNTVAGNWIVNQAERAAGVVVSGGNAEANGTVTVVWSGGWGAVSKTYVAGADGQWSVTFNGADWTAVDGTSTISVTVQDQAGNVSTPTTHQVDVRTGPPAETPVIATVTNDDVSPNLVISSGGSGNDATPVISGTFAGNNAPPNGYTVKVYDGATLLGSTVVSGATWSFKVPAGVALSGEGIHTLCATVVDTDGNEGSASVAFQLDLDTTGPSVTPVITSVLNEAAAPLQDGQATTGTHLTLSGYAQQLLAAGESLVVYDGTVSLGVATTSVVAYLDQLGNPTQSLSWSFLATMSADALHNLKVYAVDAAGNKSTNSAAFTVITDNTAPSQSLTVTSYYDDMGTGTGTGWFGTSTTTNDTTPILKGTVSSMLSQGDAILVYDVFGGNTTLLGTASVALNGAVWEWTLDTSGTPLANGSHGIQALLVDAVGNTGNLASGFVFTVNNNPPPAPVINTVRTGDIVNASSKTVTLNGSAASGSTVYIDWMGTQKSVVLAAASTSWSAIYVLDYPTGTPAGMNTDVVAYATDSQGTQSNRTVRPVIAIDTAAPSSTPKLIGYLGDHIAVVETTSGKTPVDKHVTLTGTVSLALAANEVVKIYDNTTAVGNATVVGTTWTYDTGLLLNGTHSYTAKVYDAAGNVGTASSAISVVVNQQVMAANFSGPGTGGIKAAIIGPNAFWGTGLAMTDLDGDGLVDFVVASTNFYGSSIIRSVGLVGTNTGIGNISGFKGTNGFRWVTLENSTGGSNAAVGDWNGDGYADFATSDSGFVDIVYGGTSWASSAYTGSVAIPTAGTSYATGFRLKSAAYGSYLGALASAGDFNGDGRPDIVANSGSYGVENVVFNRNNSVNLGSSLASADGMVITSTLTTANSAAKLGFAGDINGDGYDDIIIGEPGLNNNRGRAAVIYGRSTGATVNIETLTSQDGFMLSNGSGTTAPMYTFGMGVGTAGDFNGDGYADIAIGEPGADSANGRTYLIFGGPPHGAVDVSTLDSATGLKIIGETAYHYQQGAGFATADINGDGLDDLVITTKGYGSSVNSSAYVVFGRTDTGNIDLAAVAAGIGGFVIRSPATADSLNSIAVGDLDGDGLADIGFASVSGQALYVWKSADSANRDRLATTSWGSATGTVADENFAGTTGADTISGGGGRDVIYSGAGDDTIILDRDNVVKLGHGHQAQVPGRVDGGTGFDTLQLSEGGIALDFFGSASAVAPELRNLNAGIVKGIERIDLGGYATGNRVELKTTDVFHIVDANHHELFITGGSNDHVDLGSGFVKGASGQSFAGLPGTYTSYTWGSQTVERLLVQDGLDTTTNWTG